MITKYRYISNNGDIEITKSQYDLYMRTTDEEKQLIVYSESGIAVYYSSPNGVIYINYDHDGTPKYNSLTGMDSLCAFKCRDDLVNAKYWKI